MDEQNKTLAETMARIETKLDIAIGRVDDHETRLRALEGKSGKRWEAIVVDVIKLFLAAGIGFLLAQVGI